MREFKFRAFGGIEPAMYFMDTKSSIGMLKDLQEEDNWKVMQYTGLKDKNGTEIYEGDIVENEYRYKIEFITGCFCVKDKFGSTGPLFERSKPIEIIGNIYESPELMEKEDVPN